MSMANVGGDQIFKRGGAGVMGCGKEFQN